MRSLCFALCVDCFQIGSNIDLLIHLFIQRVYNTIEAITYLPQANFICAWRSMKSHTRVAITDISYACVQYSTYMEPHFINIISLFIIYRLGKAKLSVRLLIIESLKTSYDCQMDSNQPVLNVPCISLLPLIG